jgi:hypothetical protein
MRDPGGFPTPLSRRVDNDASSASPTQPARRSEQYDGETCVDDRAGSAAEDLAEEKGDHKESKDGKGRPEAKVAESVADACWGGRAACAVDTSKSKRELYHEAKNAGIKGRSAMNKEQLVEALRKHQAPRPARRASTGRQPRSEGRSAPSEVDSAEGVRPAADPRRPDRCAIVYQGSGRHGEFQVVVPQAGGSRRSAARSPAFRAPRAGAIRRRGAARAAHELLVRRLEACGWWPAGSGETWHELGFVRLRTVGKGIVHSLVTVVREAGQARFVAEELDTYGNPTPLVVSAPFSAPRLRSLRPSLQAKAALKQLVMRMEPEGWKLAAAVGKEWYAISLWRPGTETGRRALRDPARGVALQAPHEWSG